MAWLPGFKYRRKITVDNTKIDGVLSNFPIAVHLGATVGLGATDLSAVFSALTDSDKKKIAITAADGVTQCYVEIEHWTSASTLGMLHFKAPTVQAGTDTDFYFYYDADQHDNVTYAGTTGSSVAANVWDANFLGVYHMNQNPASGATIYDSTSNNADGVSQGSMTSGDLVDGLGSAKGLELEGTDDRISFPTNMISTSSEVTYDFIFKAAAADTTQDSALCYNDAANFHHVLMLNSGGTANQVRQYLTDSPAFDTNGAISNVAAYNHYSLRAKETDKATMRVNAATLGTDDLSFGNFGSQSTAGHYVGTTRSGTEYSDGIVSEYRLSDAYRSDAWMKATYHTLFDNLLTWGELETKAGSDTWLAGFDNRRAITIPASVTGSTLTDFPVCFRIGSSSGLGSTDLSGIFTALTDSNRKQIAVTTDDGVTQCPVEIESWDSASDSAVLHSKIPALNGGVDNTIYLYYGAGADNDFWIGDIGDTLGQEVWDDDFTMVNHGRYISGASMNSCGATIGTYTNMDATNEKTGLVGSAFTYNGSDENLDFGRGPAVNAGTNWTVESVFKVPVLQSAFETMSSKYDQIQDEGHLLAMSAADKITLDGRDHSAYRSAACAMTITADTWYYAAGRITGGRWFCGIDNQATSSMTESVSGVQNQSQDAPGADLQIGRSSVATFFTGLIDESRYSIVPRSAAWMKATYYTLFDQQMTYGAEESVGWLGTYAYRRKFTVGASVVGATLNDFPVGLHIGSAVGKLGGRAGSDLSGTLATASGLTDNQARQLAVTASDGLTECFVEIERWTSASTLAMLHFKAPTLNPAANTEFYFYWDVAASDNAKVGQTGSTSAASVWDSNFLEVIHMNANGSTLYSAVSQGTLNLNGTLADGNGEGSDKILTANADTDFIDHASLNFTNTFTIETKLRINSGGPSPGYDQVFGEERTISLLADHTSGVNWTLYTGSGGAWDGATPSDTNLAEDIWYNLGISYDTGTFVYRRDGATDGGGSGTNRSISTDFHLFRRKNLAANEYRFHGDISEFRISNLVRSPDWMDSTSYSLDDTFGFWAATESYTGGTGGTGSTAATAATPPPSTGAFGEIAINGSWKSVNSCYIAISSAWKSTSKIYISINNQWKIVT